VSLPGFEPQRLLSLISRVLRGPEEAMHVYRELLGLESGSRERAVEFVAQMAQRQGLDATPLFEGILRFGPSSAARVAAAAYLAEQGHEDTVLEALVSLQPPMLTMTLVTGLLDVLAERPATAERIGRLIAFGERFDDEAQYSTLMLGHFTGRDVKRAVRRTLAESLIRRDAAPVVSWPREPARGSE
jgi:hypothetical protein